MDFNIQTALTEMRKESREDIHFLAEKMDEGFAAGATRTGQLETSLAVHAQADLTSQAALDKRLAGLEGIHQSIKWFVRTAIVGLLAFLYDMLANHIPHLVAAGVKLR